MGYWVMHQGQQVGERRSRKEYKLWGPCSQEGNTGHHRSHIKIFSLCGLLGKCVCVCACIGFFFWAKVALGDPRTCHLLDFFLHILPSHWILSPVFSLHFLCWNRNTSSMLVHFHTCDHWSPPGSDLFRENKASWLRLWQIASSNLWPMRLPGAQETGGYHHCSLTSRLKYRQLISNP